VDHESDSMGNAIGFSSMPPLRSRPRRPDETVVTWHGLSNFRGNRITHREIR